MLQVNKITVELGNNEIIKNLSFSIESGIVVILGLNGSGKTTLLRSIAGILKIKQGTILIDDIDITKTKKHKISKLISLVPQEFTLLFDYTVEEMILFGRTPYIGAFKMPSCYDYKIISKILNEMNIEDLRYRKFNELSGGEKRLVLISMILAQNTRIVLFDEPTSFLDIKNSIIILNKIKKLASELHKIIIISLHDLNEAINTAEWVLMLCESNKYKYGKVKDLINKDNLFELYHTKFDIVTTEDNKMFVIPIL